MTVFENVLVGVDGRPNGRDAITLAGQLVDRAGSEPGHSAGRAVP